MPTFSQILTERLTVALNSLDIDLPDGFQASVTPATDDRFGHYQANAAMALGKHLKENPRQLAGRLISALNTGDLCEEPQIAGPGFINFTLTPQTIAGRCSELFSDPHLGVPQAGEPRRIVVDFSAPNVAKPMHVGHLRSTIIGDSLARVARAVGHHVITDNHIGDWGTQFGMIIHGWKTLLDQAALKADPIAELVRVYRTVNAQTKEDSSVLETCKAELVALQSGDTDNLTIWQQCMDLSLKKLQEIYGWLDICFDHYLGESAYNEHLAPLVESLLTDGTAEISKGAVCVFFPDTPALKDKPCLIRKQDGGFLYATTDLATIDHRINEWEADEIWYVVGAPQALHFQQVFGVSERRGQKTKLVHVAHGSILGDDGKLMRTRAGKSVDLLDVLQEAVERSRKVIEEKNPSLSEDEKGAISKIVGLGAAKYFELSQHRMTDYMFKWDKMLALTGNTAPYLQNSYVRVRAIFRKTGTDGAQLPEQPTLSEAQEIALALKITQFGEIVPEILNDYRPNILAAYLFELAKVFHSFYEACPVLREEGTVRENRLLLCDLTGRVLERGLSLLGIQVPEKM